MIEYIYSHPELESMRGNPDKILAAMDDFSSQQDLLISVGHEKAKILRELVASQKPQVGVELGGYLGYSAILFADEMRRNAAPGASPRFWSLEASPVYAAFIMSMVDLAGLSDIVKVATGPAEASLRRLKQSGELKHADLVFMDHVEELYATDLKLCVELGLLRAGSLVVADNLVRPGAPGYREYIASQARFESKAVSCLLTPGDLPVCLSLKFVRCECVGLTMCFVGRDGGDKGRLVVVVAAALFRVRVETARTTSDTGYIHRRRGNRQVQHQTGSLWIFFEDSQPSALSLRSPILYHSRQLLAYKCALFW